MTELDKEMQEDYDNLNARAKQSDSLESFINDIGMGDFVKDGLTCGIVRGEGELGKGRNKILCYRVETATGKEVFMFKEWTKLITHGGFDDSILIHIYNTAKEVVS